MRKYVFIEDKVSFMMVSTKITKQLFCIFSIVVLFLSSAVFRFMLLGEKIPVAIIVLMMLLIVFCLSLLFGILQKDDIPKKIIKNKYEALVFLAVLMLRIPLIQDMQRWDGGLYYSCIYDAVHNFSFSLDYLWNTMRFAGHPTIMFCFFSMIGEFITHGSSIGVGVVYILMSAASMVCLYKLFIKYNPEVNEFRAFVIILMIQCIPLFWGTVSYVNPDYMYLLFFIYFWYTHVNGEYLLCAFWMFCMFQTKELGIIIAAGYVAGHVLNFLFEKRCTNKERIISLVIDPLIIISFINVLIMIAYYCFQGTLGSWEITTGETFRWFVPFDEVQLRGTDVNAFGIYPMYMACKLLQLFAINFNWIASLGIIISGVELKKSGEVVIRKQSLPIAVSMFAFVIFGLFFITFAILRYNVFFHVMLWFAFVSLEYRAFGSKLIVTRICSFWVCVLLCVQTFFYIDPLTNLFFLRVDSGKGKIVASEMRKRYFGDSLVNNFRYTYIDGLLNKLLSEVSYEGTEKIICFDSSIDTSNIRYLNEGKELGWNPKTKRRTLLQKNENGEVISIDTVDYDTLLTACDDIYDSESKFIIYFMRYIDVDEEAVIKELKDKFVVSEKNRLENWGGTMDYYVLRLRRD